MSKKDQKKNQHQNTADSLIFLIYQSIDKNN